MLTHVFKLEITSEVSHCVVYVIMFITAVCVRVPLVR